MALSRLVKEFSKNEKLMAFVTRYYDLVAEYDRIYVKRTQLRAIMDDRSSALTKLIAEYNGIAETQLDRRMEIGQKIKSLKLEIDKNLGAGISEIDLRIEGIKREINEEVNPGIRDLINGRDLDMATFKSAFGTVFSNAPGSALSNKKIEYREKVDEKDLGSVEHPTAESEVP